MELKIRHVIGTSIVVAGMTIIIFLSEKICVIGKFFKTFLNQANPCNTEGGFK